MTQTQLSSPPVRAELSAAQRELLERRLRGEVKPSAATAAAIPHRMTPDTAPLSYDQQRLWFLEQLQPGTPLYSIPHIFRLSGPLEVEAFEGSLTEIIRRHEILRSTFHARDGEPFQRIEPAGPVALPVTDLAALPVEARLAEARRLAAEEAGRPFDLSRGPVCRAALVRLAATEHWLLLNVHHLVFDAWSEEILQRELAAIYRAQCEGKPHELPDLAVQYGDFAAWQCGHSHQESIEPHLAYWKQRLSPMPERLNLPTDAPRAAAVDNAGATERLTLDEALLQQLKTLSRAENATLYMTLLAAWEVLLHRYSQQDDLIIGTPMAGRAQHELEPLIGFFVNTLVVRETLAGDLPFRRLLQRVRETVLAAIEHQVLPFERLARELATDRAEGQNPLFDVMFVFQVGIRRQWKAHELTIETLDAETGTAKFDLTLFVTDEGQALQLALEYRTSLFQPETARRMLRHYGQLLRSIAANPDAPLNQLALLEPAEREQLLHGWNATASPYPDTACVHELVEAQAQRPPDALAAVFEGERLSYRELEARAATLATVLRGLGVGPDVCVGICVERSLEMLVGVLAILKAGGAYVPLDPGYPAERLAGMVQDAKAPVVLTLQKLADLLPRTEAKLVCLDEPLPAVPPASAAAFAKPGPDNLAYVIFTSGSTGRPKGVAMPHRALVNLIAWQLGQSSAGRGSRTVQFTSLSFDVSFQEIFSTWCSGGTLVIIPEMLRRDLPALWTLLAEQQVERLFLPFVALQQLAEIAATVAVQPARLREIITAGEQLRITPALRALFERLPGCTLHNHYGPSESHVVTAFTLQGPPGGWPALPPIGRPIQNCRIRLLDPHCQPVPVGVPGELHIGGVCLAREYLERPELTAEKFMADPFSRTPGDRLYRTGDLARLLSDGNLEFLGRLDFQVKIRGYRVELGEIETALAQQPGVREVIVATREDTPGDKRLVAYLVPKPSATLLPQALRDGLRRNLPDYMVPAQFVLLDALPLTPSGKVNRKALPAPEITRTDPVASDTVPQTPTEEKLALIWSEVLGVAPVRRTDNFFDLGGHSLLATRLLARVNQTFGAHIPLAALFRTPTVEQFARQLDNLQEIQHVPSLVPLQAEGDRPPLFWVHTIGEDNGGLFLYRRIVQHLGPAQPSYGIEAPVQPFHDLMSAAAEYVARIRTIQPHGPYFLAGYCFGGHLAFEMARQLEQQAEPVGLLLLIETGANLAHKPCPWTWRTPGHVAGHLFHWTMDFMKRGPSDMRMRFGRFLKTRRSRWRKQGNEARAWAESLDNTFNFAMHPPAFREYAHAHWQALREYRPGVYGGPAALFRTRKHGLWEFDPCLRWREICTGPFETLIIPGEHANVFDPPHVQELARRIQTTLAAARATAARPTPR